MTDTPTFGRYTEMAVDKMTPEQRAGYRFLADGPRGQLPGPYKIWVHNPKLLHAAAPLGQHFTLGPSSLSEREREIAVVVMTSQWHSASPPPRTRRAARRSGCPRRGVGRDHRRPPGLVHGRPGAGRLRNGDDARRQPTGVSGLYDAAVEVLGHESITDVMTNFYAVPAGAPGLARTGA
jgi:4-carboxymuconolactone decarboxylase